MPTNMSNSHEFIRLAKLKNSPEKGFDKFRTGKWNEIEDGLFYYSVKLFKKDYRAISVLMGMRDLRPIRSSVQKKVKKPKDAEQANLIKDFGSKKETNNSTGVTIAGGCNKDFSNFLLGRKKGRLPNYGACSARMAVAIRDVLLTRFFERNDWSTLDKDHMSSKPSRFADWPRNVFAKEKKAGDSNSSEPKPRKRDAKADRKNVYNTSCNSPNS